ncbi:MAG: WD40 repeat domain-containing protein [Verrucomicrobiales bacterium]|nr:WD40 repeat domain-containing protein [Verrucomicrobiales bacterium]
MRAAFSPTGDRTLVYGYLSDIACSNDLRIMGLALWSVNVSQGGIEHHFEEPCSPESEDVIGWTWSPDGDRIVTLIDATPNAEGSPDRVKIWDAATGEVQLTFTVPGVAAPHQMTWLLPGNTIVTPNSDGRIRSWDAATGQMSGNFHDPFEGPCGRFVVVSLDRSRAADIVPLDQPNERHPRVWDLDAGTSQLVEYSALGPSYRPEIHGMTFSNDARFLWVGQWQSPTDVPNDTFLFDASTGELLTHMKGAGDLASQSSISNDGRRVLTLREGEIAIWDISNLLAKPRLRMGETGPEISWYLGTLQFAPTVDGPWVNLPAASPFPLSPIGEKGFFRVKVDE